MKCYYEELGVARDASDGDIKTAYRKLALRWHPDKNPNNMDEAKERFQLLQQAYEVLSDMHERAWYDNHREQILRGKNSNYEDNCLDVFQYFTVSCFKGYGDDSKGFYKVYAEVFENIAAEDAEFMDDEEEVEEIPKFGDSTSSYEDVVGPFYAYWQSYCTKKTYTWLCPYDITEIKDRRVLREIEKDMKKIVQKAKKERNEEVRNLVSFIRKRDKRVQANKKLLEEKAALNRQKQEQNRLEQIRKRQREVEEMKKANGHDFNDGYEEQLKKLQEEYAELASDSEDDEESEDSKGMDELTRDMDIYDDDELQFVDDLYCVACNRAFTNDNAFINHETSKKHKENIERLKREMLNEDSSFKDEEAKAGPPLAEEDDLEGLQEDLDDLEVEVETEPATSNKKKKGKKNKKGKKPANDPIDVEEESAGEVQDLEETIEQIVNGTVPDSDEEWDKSKKSTKKTRNKKPQKKSAVVEPTPPQPEESSAKPPSSKSESEDKDPNLTCVTCNSVFESKNKLFTHLKKTNHGVYIPKAKPKATKPETASQTQATKKSTKGKRK